MLIRFALEGSVNVLIIIYIKFHFTLQKRFLGRMGSYFFIHNYQGYNISDKYNNFYAKIPKSLYNTNVYYLVVFEQTSKNTFLLWHNRGVLMFLLIFSSTVNCYITTIACSDAIPR